MFWCSQPKTAWFCDKSMWPLRHLKMWRKNSTADLAGISSSIGQFSQFALGESKFLLHITFYKMIVCVVKVIIIKRSYLNRQWPKFNWFSNNLKQDIGIGGTQKWWEFLMSFLLYAFQRQLGIYCICYSDLLNRKWRVASQTCDIDFLRGVRSSLPDWGLGAVLSWDHRFWSLINQQVDVNIKGILFSHRIHIAWKFRRLAKC